MARLGCRDMAAYLARLSRDDGARRACDRLLTVSISRFFRDRALWRVLADEILPGLMRSAREDLRVWVAGCASGEEAYSLRIVREELRAAYPAPAMAILATDLNPHCLRRARTGAYAPSSLKELPGELKSRYFSRRAGENRFSVNPFLKKGIIWKHHDFLDGLPGPRFDLIFLRNSLLTYYRNDICQAVLKNAITSLTDEGILIIGTLEKLPWESEDFLLKTAFPYVFKKAL